MKRLPKAAANLVGGGLFLALFVVFVAQVTARFVFNQPLPWTDELAVILYIWVILWATATMVPDREHVVFDLVWNHVGRRTRRVMQIVGQVAIGGLAAAALPATWDYVSFMRREGTPVLDLPFFWVFLPFVLLLVAMVLRALHTIWRAIRGQGLDAELHLP